MATATARAAMAGGVASGDGATSPSDEDSAFDEEDDELEPGLALNSISGVPHRALSSISGAPRRALNSISGITHQALSSINGRNRGVLRGCLIIVAFVFNIGHAEMLADALLLAL